MPSPPPSQFCITGDVPPARCDEMDGGVCGGRRSLPHKVRTAARLAGAGDVGDDSGARSCLVDASRRHARYGIWNILSVAAAASALSVAHTACRAKRVPRYPSCPLDKHSGHAHSLTTDSPTSVSLYTSCKLLWAGFSTAL